MDQTTQKQKNKKLPVTIICGFLGSGKTTLLNYILSLKHSYKVVVLVNDMGEVNIDAQLINQYSVKKTKEKLVEMQNGCICCTLREDLMKATSKLSRSQKYDYMLIESSGISEPLPIAQSWYFENEKIKKQNISLKHISRLDTMVTVVDASNFLNQIKSDKYFQELDMLKGQKMDQVPLSQLLLDQVEFANVIVLNKVDLVTQEHLGYVKELLSKLNPIAKIIESKFGRIDVREIVNTKMFDIEKAQTTTKWIQELQKPFHASETEEYNIQSCVFKARRPFHPQKLLNLLKHNDQEDKGFWKSVLRAKGFMWVAKKDRFKIEIQKAGDKLSYEPSQFWWVSLPKQKWDEDPEEIKKVERELESIWLPPPIGDKRQEIVFIGQSLQKEAIFESFEKCLLTIEEFDNYLTLEIEDVFPKEWDTLAQFFAQKGIIREDDAEWEDQWDEANEEEEQSDEEIQQQ